MSYLVMVLNDGETFTDLSGCAIVRVPSSDVESIEEFLDSENGDDVDGTVAVFDVIDGRAALIARDGSIIWKEQA